MMKLVKVGLFLIGAGTLVGVYILTSLHGVRAATVNTTYTSGNSVVISTVTNQPRQLGLGANVGCVIATDRLVYCAGDNASGQLGTGPLSTSPAARSSVTQFGPSLGKYFTQVAGGSDHTCAITIEQQIWCAGANSNGQLGSGGGGVTYTPLRFDFTGADAGKKFTQVAAGTNYTCGLAVDQWIYCAGANGAPGQLGLTSGSLNRPTAASRFGQVGTASGKFFTQVGISPRSDTTCAVTTDQLIFCSGQGAAGQLGNGSSSSNNPLQFGGAAFPKKFLQVSAGDSTTCAITTDQQIWCAGSNAPSGQFGRTGTVGGATPLQFSTGAGGAGLGKLYTQVSVSEGFVCGLSTEQKIYCAGLNNSGQLGDGTTTTRMITVQFGAGSPVASKLFLKVLTGYKSDGTGLIKFTCGLATDYTVYCAGNNSFGNFGTGGTSATNSTPILSMTTLP